MKISTLILPAIAVCALAIQPSFAADRVKTANGILESTSAPKDGVRSFKGIPFGQPPVGELRWGSPSRSRTGPASAKPTSSGRGACNGLRPARTTGSAATA